MKPPNICYAKDCDKLIHAKNYCEKHYRRLKKHGFVDDLPNSREQKCQHCDNKIGRQGCISRCMCKHHYDTFLEHGDALYHTKQQEYKKNALAGLVKDDDIYFRKNIKPHPDGYIRDPDKRYVHRRIMEHKLGRSLIPHQEVVHHIDFDKLNNHPDNLHLCSNNSEHRMLHNQFEQLGTELIKRGIIIFDANMGMYKLVD